MIFKTPSLLTHLDIWEPKWSAKHTDLGEQVVLLACYKVNNGSPWIIVEITKAKSLIGLRFCIKRGEAQRYPVVKNGPKATAIDCYEVPMSKLENYDTVEDIKNIVKGFGW